MVQGIALLASGVALYALAGTVLSGALARCARSCSPRRALRLLPLALAGPLALAFAAFGAYTLDDRLSLPRTVLGLPLAAFAALSVAPLGLLAGGLLLLAAFPRRRGGGGGGRGPHDLPPPPDPDGPDGWAAFEREFRAYAAARDAARVRVPVH